MLVVSILLLTFLSIYTFVYIKNFENTSYNNINYTITGKITNKRNYSFSTNLILSNVTLLDENGNEIKLKNNISLNISQSLEDYDIGYFIVFNGKIKNTSLINEKGEINTYFVKNNIRFSVTKNVNGQDALFIESNKSIKQTIKDYNKQLLINYFGKTKGNMAFALLYGDRTEVDSDLMNTFKYSGVVHIFAVSGLHISIITSIIFFILKKLKCNKNITFLITSILFLFYCYLCSFSPSVVRASIMALTLLFSKIMHRKNDSLTTLSFAGLIILTFNPLSLFDASFELSFCSVFGIIVFMNIFKRAKIKNKLLKKSFLLIAVTLSTQIFLIPLLAKYYGYYSIWSILANFLTIPIFSIFYPLFFITNLICLVLNFCGFLFFIPNAILSLIIYINKAISSLPNGILPLFYCGGIIAIIYYCYLFFISKYFIINKKIKPIINGIGFVLVFCFFMFNSLPYVSTKNEISFAPTNYSSEYSAVISTKDNKFYLINPKMTSSSLKEITNYLNDKRIVNINGIIFSNNQKFQASRTKSFLSNYNPKLYLPKNHEAVYNFQQMNVEVEEIEYDNKTKIDNKMSIQYLQINNEFFGLIVNINNYIYLEISMEMDDNFKYEYLEEYILTNLNYSVNCVKVNDSNEKESYYRTLIKANNYIFNETHNIVLKI